MSEQLSSDHNRWRKGHDRAPILRESRHDPAVSDELLTIDTGGMPDEAVLVIPLSELVAQHRIAFMDTDVKGGKHRPQRAMARLLLVLNDLGYVHRPDERGRIVAHSHGDPEGPRW